MRIAIVGRGPVAQLIAHSIDARHEVAVVVRQPRARRGLISAARRHVGRWQSRALSRDVDAVSAAECETADVVISTAPVTDDSVAALLSRCSGVVASVSQVPSEVEHLRELAGVRPWGLLVPEFLAFGADPVQWWQPGRYRFTVAGSAAPTLREALASRVPAHETPLAAPLMTAATMMPVVAGLHTYGFDFTRTRRHVSQLAAAATQARRAVAAEYAGQTHPPAPVNVILVRAALVTLPIVAPFDVAAYASRHFGSHGDQTATLLADWVALGHRHDVPVAALENLAQQFARAQRESLEAR